MTRPFHALRLHFIDTALDDDVLFDRLQAVAEDLNIIVRSMTPNEQHEADTESLTTYTAGWWRTSTRTIALHKRHLRDPFTLAHEIGHAKCSDVVGQYHRENDADNMGRTVLLSVLSPIEREAVLWRLRFQMPERPKPVDDKVVRRAEKFLALANGSDSAGERSVALERYAELAPTLETYSPEKLRQKERALKNDSDLYRTRMNIERWFTWCVLITTVTTLVRVVVKQETNFNPLSLVYVPLFFYVPHKIFTRLALDDRYKPYLVKTADFMERTWRTMRTMWYKWSNS